MAHSDIFGQDYGYYGGMATGNGSPLIPPQFIPKKYKTKAGFSFISLSSFSFLAKKRIILCIC